MATEYTQGQPPVMNPSMELSSSAPFPSTRGMVRSNDPDTSYAAARAVSRKLNELHFRILAALRTNDKPMTAEQLERLPQFADFGPSTVRKRVSELAHMGKVLEAGMATNSRGRSMILYRLPRNPEQLRFL